ncbi:MAG: hypothetical protein A2074_05240 [Candidatus Aquicultor primus]|uniref:Alkaline shock response membrane anchor protein AmaP n=1 Tax=Candidatus Aquicultor primus TaxID=1797195 RepID=A0A1F2UX59_9ACTN|nr:MAG: hypothetical protein A2074_05240 [Candidatus Aquicultor primus]HCG98248.1 hypothetical protein [Actinomycetota bacterium]
MQTLDRVILSVIFLLIFLVSAVAALVTLGAISVGQLQSVVPYQRMVSLFTSNLVAASGVSIAVLAVFIALGILWLRGELARTVKAVIGGSYETIAAGPGMTTVDNGVIIKAIDNAIRGIPGIVNSQTRIYVEGEGRTVATSNILLERKADIHAVDKSVRDLIDEAWLRKLGHGLARHDVVVHLESQERRVV